MSNADHAAIGRQIIERYMELTHQYDVHDLETHMDDLIADLHHYATQYNTQQADPDDRVDWERVLRMAADHYRSEACHLCGVGDADVLEFPNAVKVAGVGYFCEACAERIDSNG